MSKKLYKKDVDYEGTLIPNKDYTDSIILFSSMGLFIISILCFTGVV